MMSLFPLDFSNEADNPSDLNSFSWKLIYIYDDHVSVFKTEHQVPSVQAMSGDPALDDLK